MPKSSSLTKSKPSEQASKLPEQTGKMSEAQLEMLVLKALEITMRHKPLPEAIKQHLPPELIQALLETVAKQSSREQLDKFKTLPPRLADLTERLYKRGIMARPTPQGSPLDNLSPAQRQRQLAAEALELRRQEAIRMVNAQQLLAQGSRQTA